MKVLRRLAQAVEQPEEKHRKRRVHQRRKQQVHAEQRFLLGQQQPLRKCEDYLVEVESEATVRALTPDFGALGAIRARGIIVTARASSPGFDFVSRFFAPAAGINEDPVTGSAHSTLGPFWSQRLGKTSFTARQVSLRGGVVEVEVAGDRVLLGGRAVTVLRGELV